MKVAECSIWQFYTKETQGMHVVFGISTRKKRKGSSEIGWIDFLLCEEREKENQFKDQKDTEELFPSSKKRLKVLIQTM